MLLKHLTNLHILLPQALITNISLVPLSLKMVKLPRVLWLKSFKDLTVKPEMKVLEFNLPIFNQLVLNLVRKLSKLSTLSQISMVKRNKKHLSNFLTKLKKKKKRHGNLNSFLPACFIQPKTKKVKLKIFLIWRFSCTSPVSDGNFCSPSFHHPTISVAGAALFALWV